jgi:hypothetical protein
MNHFQTAVIPSRKRHNRSLSFFKQCRLPCVILVLIISIMLVVGLQYSSMAKIRWSKKNHNRTHSCSLSHLQCMALSLPAAHDLVTTKRKPLVTFVIPSTLKRSTLSRTIQSLQHQTRPDDWEAIVGVDLVRSRTRLKESDIPKKSATFRQDSRVHYVPIHVQSTNRGIYGNGAGKIRNEIIKRHAQSDWVAFVDDDDTVVPSYVEHLLQAIRQQPSVDVVVFRMRDASGNILPPVEHQMELGACNVGISFAVRRELFVRSEDPVVFVPGATEDFVLLKTAFQRGSMILLSNCVGYFVRNLPDESLLDATAKGPCNLFIIREVKE